ncbi:dual specificity mitogen-activated protein kinase kinase 5 isoform X9 [Lontra canadensis]|uniref:dual specificity mitogen-activated protein kinase kinase 5 isoform X9 n=1 Tax=Lontra canadensis TaxID=76717 RepID=UPI0013F364AC|nr:dual specificity mitogen-activated protein kinase kinase 5 isoform X9 [Lontra canadensis]
MLWLALGPFHAMENQVLVIRIKIPNSGAVDWTVHSGPQLLFRDVLDVIGQVLPEATTTAFEYEDEDGDRITVRSDEEMKAMLSYYYSTVMEQQVNGQLIEPLQIFPRACKPPGERNIHGLKVNTRAGPSQHDSPVVSDSRPSNSLKKSSAELRKILANGQMNEQDIRYRDTLGHGNGGTVYKAYHVPSGKILAVKVILLDITLELQKQIMSELEILYKCDSSYIIGFYGAFFVENRISICTEFMDGGSLDVYRKIPEHVLGRIAIAVVKGLTYLWSLKILHRDSQEGAKKRYKKNAHARAFFLRKEFGRELEASYPKECRQNMSISGLEAHGRDQWKDRKNRTNPKESKEKKKRETECKWDK